MKSRIMKELKKLKEVKEVKEVKGRYLWKIGARWQHPNLLSFNFPSERSELTSFNFITNP